ncbi:MAG: GerW family sporulation protein [Anaeroplasmataceae bacterium]|nr:GerW family sporulation protein [Anaeroplasmataceae bacterium]MDE6241755.1 GerW family sporulation protein [Anaeroplasmataceae bacterium]
MGNITDLLNVSMNKIKEMIDANTIIGTPITEGETLIIPVSKLHLGFVSGGSDIKPNSSKEEVLFGGGAGGGFGITPIAFLVINKGEVSLLSIDESTHIAEKLIDLVPKTVEKCKTLFKNNAPIEKV